MIACDRCGATSASEVPPLTWGMSVDNGRTTRYCEPCTRDALRVIEGRLDAVHS